MCFSRVSVTNISNDMKASFKQWSCLSQFISPSYLVVLAPETQESESANDITINELNDNANTSQHHAKTVKSLWSVQTRDVRFYRNRTGWSKPTVLYCLYRIQVPMLLSTQELRGQYIGRSQWCMFFWMPFPSNLFWALLDIVTHVGTTGSTEWQRVQKKSQQQKRRSCSSPLTLTRTV